MGKSLHDHVMFLRALTFLVFCFVATTAAADNVTFVGSIGPFEVEAELQRDAAGQVNGRYRYVGKDAWLTLTAEVYGQDVIQMIEQLDGELTGTFFLDITPTALVGFWVVGDTDYPVHLETRAGHIAMIAPPSKAPNVNTSLTGRYAIHRYWVNDLFAPDYEVGFNGGDVNVVQMDEDTLLIHFSFVVGPTYHFAVFQGVANRLADGLFVHSAMLPGSDEPCALSFRFDDGSLQITDHMNGAACQFGARAHANFALQKVSNTAEFEDAW
ncbi:MAG: hypothetical protein AAGF56_04375 [Pseudomonadota bacterium]